MNHGGEDVKVSIVAAVARAGGIPVVSRRGGRQGYSAVIPNGPAPCYRLGERTVTHREHVMGKRRIAAAIIAVLAALGISAGIAASAASTTPAAAAPQTHFWG